MEQAMGEDFKHVRIHADAQADGLNLAIAAQAFTTEHHMISQLPQLWGGSLYRSQCHGRFNQPPYSSV
jgi:hypothetical protein